EMYADRKRWQIGEVVVDVDYEPAQRGSPTKFEMTVKLPKELPEEQRERLMQIAARCPVQRTLEGEVVLEEPDELVQPTAPTAASTFERSSAGCSSAPSVPCTQWTGHGPPRSANDPWAGGCQSRVATTRSKSPEPASSLIRSAIRSPSGTASAPPGVKSLW